MYANRTSRAAGAARGGFTLAELPAASRRGREAFTLAELMIALGIMGVGLAVLLALFVTTVAENKTSVHDLLGSMICENALTTARVKLRASDVPYNAQLQLVSTTALPDIDLAHPVGTTSNYLLGSAILARKITNNSAENDYLLVVISCERTTTTATVTLVPLTGLSIPAGATTFDAGAIADIKIGTPVIEPVWGRYATVVGKDGATVLLDHPISTEKVDDPWVITQNTPVVKSPAMHVLVTRTALRN